MLYVHILKNHTNGVILKTLKMIETSFISPLGEMTICSDGECLTGVSFGGREIEAEERGAAPVLEQAVKWLDIYFGGGVPGFTPPIRLNVSPFCREVCEILLSIPYGHTATYGEIAKILAARHGIARMSAQAVGGAVHRNPVAVIIPCHRVIGSDGSLTGYAAGLELKAKLLELEKSVSEKRQ